MATKKPTAKQLREAKQKAALLRRVTDVYCGSIGSDWDSDNFATADNLALIMPALKALFGHQKENSDFVWGLHCIRYFDTPETATDHLWEYGFRA